MSTFLATHGISHQTSPPHTPEHNGFSEHHHRHIVETSLALLSQASFSLSFWSYAFIITTYLINRLPTSTLKMSSPYHKLFMTPPNYSKLHVFGCLCYPRLRPYSLHKLAPRSTPCVCLGYLLTQSAYICFDPSTTKTYFSYHIRFIESIFPLSVVNPSLPQFDDSTISTWFLITLVDLAPLRRPLSSTRPGLVDPNRNPRDACLILLFYILLSFLFQKCRDLNPWLDPKGGSEPEPGLLRCFHLSYQNIYLCHFVLRFSISRKHFQMGGPNIHISQNAITMKAFYAFLK